MVAVCTAGPVHTVTPFLALTTVLSRIGFFASAAALAAANEEVLASFSEVWVSCVEEPLLFLRQMRLLRNKNLI